MKLTVGKLREIIKGIPDHTGITLEVGGDEYSYGQLATARSVKLDALFELLISDEDKEEI